MFQPKYTITETKKEGVYYLWPTKGTVAVIAVGYLLAVAPYFADTILDAAKDGYDRLQQKKNLKKNK